MVERRVVVDHVVADLEASGRFYDAALAPLGFTRLRTGDVDGATAYGLAGADDFAIQRRHLARDSPACPEPSG